MRPSAAPFTQLLGAPAPWIRFLAIQLLRVVERLIMVFIPSHPEGANYFKALTRPWVRLRAASSVKLRYCKPLTDFLIIAGHLMRPDDRGELLLRFRVVDGRLKIETYVSQDLQGTDLEYSLELLAWHFEIAWRKVEVLKNGQ